MATRSNDLLQPPLNSRLAGLSRSATLAINERSARLIAEGREIIRLGLGQSPFPVPPSLVQALRKNAAESDYLPVKGLPELRHAICGFLQRTEHLDYAPENIIVGPGTKELMFLLQLAHDSDLVIPAPSWVSYAPQADILGRPVHWLPTSIEQGLRLTPDVLAHHCEANTKRAQLLIINYPGNPTGTEYSEELLREIGDVARRYGVVILADEIYSGTNFKDNHVSIARYYPEGTIVANGISKWCSAGGWRLGAFAFPESLSWLLEAVATAASETYSAASTPVQHAAIKAFDDNPEIDRHLTDTRRILQALMTFSHDSLLQAGAYVPEPEGAFYVFPVFKALAGQLKNRDINTGSQLCERALEETGIALLPGADFGRPDDELSLRLACVDFDGVTALNALRELPDAAEVGLDFLDRYCQPTVDGIRRLCDWIHRLSA